MSDNAGEQEKMAQVLDTLPLKLVIGKWMNCSPRPKYLVAVCLFGGKTVGNARRKAEHKANLPRRTIMSVLGKPLGFIRGNGTLLESLKGGVAWNDGEKPHEFFNLYGMTPEGDYYLLPYTKPISELPSEVFLMGVGNEYESKEEMLKAVTRNGRALKDAAPQLQEDLEVVRAAVTQNGLALQFASKALRKNREVVRAAVTQNGLALQYAHCSLWSNREIVLAALTQNGLALMYADSSLWSDLEVVRAAVTQNGLALQFASRALRKNREVVRAAVTQDGRALWYASEAIKADREVVIRAVRQNSNAFCYLSQQLQHDHEIRSAAGINN